MATPMLDQYTSMKREYPDTILLFRLGDFYEGFEDDAKILSKVLGITLTGRGASENRKPMAGIPYHALNQYLPKLIKAGYKVAIAEQMEEAKPGQIVDRQVTKIITAGTIIDEKSLDESDNNYIASIFLEVKSKYQVWGFAFADISTGEFKATEYRTISSERSLPSELAIELTRIAPTELIINKGLSQVLASFGFVGSIREFSEGEYFESELRKSLLDGLKAESFKGFGLDDLTAGIIAAGKLYEYILKNRKTDIPHINKLSRHNFADYMLLDEATIRNLELLYPIRDNNVGKTLYGVLNHCQTAMGQRMLRQWVLRPLIKLNDVQSRLDKVGELVENADLYGDISESLSQIADLERVLARIGGKSANARDMIFLKIGVTNSLSVIELIKNSKAGKALREYEVGGDNIKNIRTNVIELIEKSILDNPSLTITEGGIIKDGYSKELDGLKKDSAYGKDYIKGLEEREIKRSGISSLKVRYNKVFGYYIEISNSNLAKVPADYIRKQTLVNGERYITEELKEWEDKVLGAEEKLNFMEYQEFEKIRMQVLSQVSELQTLIKIIAEVDVLTNFARLAKENSYVRPAVCDDLGKATSIIGGRHPVVESFMNDSFVPNDIAFDPVKQQAIILTGPNMSGKSTYIRQVALIFLMCQIGCYVPTERADIVLADRIFTRVGASDNLASGESTFMVEMNETANILNNATNRSLVILDEVGRGTSTFDGVSIAWSIAEQIVEKIGARTLFATHYHELIELESLYKTIKNFNIQVIEKNGKIYFMHKIVPGGTDKSYGVHVAEIAGIPKEVIDRSFEILRKLEKEAELAKPSKKIKANHAEQMTLMLKEPKNKLLDDILSLDLNTITPIDALNILKDVQEKSKAHDH